LAYSPKAGAADRMKGDATRSFARNGQSAKREPGLPCPMTAMKVLKLVKKRPTFGSSRVYNANFTGGELVL
jgi:hypothetical protein